MTVSITMITDGATLTIDPFRVITLDLVSLVVKSIVTEIVNTMTTAAVPVLDAVESVRVPSIRFPLTDSRWMMVIRSTVRSIRSGCVTVIVTIVTDRSVTTVSVGLVVTAHILQIKHLWQTCSWIIRTPVNCGFMGRAGPVLPAVVWVRVISIRFVTAVKRRIGIGTRSRSGGSVLTVIVAFVTFWSHSTIGVFLVITSHVDQIKHLRFASVRVVLTQEVLSGAILEALPVFPTVVGVCMESLS